MFNLVGHFAQSYSTSSSLSSSSSTSSGAFYGVLLFVLPLLILMLAANWRVFTKAGKPGWAVLVPIYNTVVMLQIIGRPLWWLALIFGAGLLSLIPFVGWIAPLVIGIIIANDLAKSFGKTTGMTVLLVLLPFVGYPMLAWGDAHYQGPAALKGGADGAGHAPMAGPTSQTPPTTPTTPQTPAAPQA